MRIAVFAIRFCLGNATLTQAIPTAFFFIFFPWMLDISYYK